MFHVQRGLLGEGARHAVTGDPGPAPSLKPRADDCKRCADDPLFTQAQNDEAGIVAHNAKPISNSDAVIDRIRAGFAKRHGAAPQVAIEKVRGMDDLPPAWHGRHEPGAAQPDDRAPRDVPQWPGLGRF